MTKELEELTFKWKATKYKNRYLMVCGVTPEPKQFCFQKVKIHGDKNEPACGLPVLQMVSATGDSTILVDPTPNRDGTYNLHNCLGAYSASKGWL